MIHAVLKYDNVNEDVVIQCDASQAGLGATLLQQERPVTFASRALKPAECNKFTQYSSLWDTLKMMLFTKYLVK